MKIKVAPSILSADFGDLNREIEEVQSHCDQIHVDVMDGHFVPNITIGAPVVACLTTALPLNTHLMIENPLDFVDDFVKAGSDRIVIHIEAVDDLRAAIEEINSYDIESGVSVKPGTSVDEVKDVLDIVDEVLVMTVEPGFGGQSFMKGMVSKIEKLREWGFEGDIGVDGGINVETSRLCREAGANLLIAGSYIFKAKDRVDAIYSLKE